MKSKDCRDGVAECNGANDERDNRLMMRFATVVPVKLVGLGENVSEAPQNQQIERPGRLLFSAIAIDAESNSS